MRYFIYIFLFITTSSLSSQFAFNRTYNYNNYVEGGDEIVCAEDGIMYIIGKRYMFIGSQPDHGSTDAFVSIYKVLPTGKLDTMYNYTIYQNDKEYVEGVVLSGDTLTIVLTTNSDAPGENMKVLRTSIYGEVIQLVSIPSSDSDYSTLSFKKSNDGGYLGCGWKQYPNTNETNILIYKLNADLELEWMHDYHNDDYIGNYGTDLVEDDIGNIYVSALMIPDPWDYSIQWAIWKFDLEGLQTDYKEYLDDGDYGAPLCMTFDFDSTILMGGNIESSGKFLRIDTLLNILDLKSYDFFPGIFSLADIYSKNGVYYCPLFRDIGNSDISPVIRAGLAKFDSELNLLWHKVYEVVPNNIHQYGYGYTQTPDGGFAICGMYIPTAADDPDEYNWNDMWLVKVDSLGNDTLPLSNLMPDVLELTLNEDTILTALTYGGSNCYQNIVWTVPDGLNWYMDEADSMSLHILATELGSYAIGYYVEDITGVPLWDTCHVSIISSGIPSSYIENSESKIVISPHPVPDHFTISIIDADIRLEQIRIYGVDGQLLLSRAFDGREIDITGLSDGLYLLELLTANGIKICQKLVVNH